MSKVAKFSDEQKYEIVLELLAGKLSHGEICRKYGISATYAYKLKDGALEILRKGVGRSAGRPDAESERLRQRVRTRRGEEVELTSYRRLQQGGRMQRALKKTNEAVSRKVHVLREEIQKEFGLLAPLAASLLGPLLL